MTSQYASHGRGGAGNMSNAKSSPKLKPSDLETPTLKKDIVTTGRGGTGNMAKNKDPVETRLRQDVRPIPRRYSSGAQHAGRGGAGNVFKDDAEELSQITSRKQAISDDIERPDTPSKLRKGWPFSKKA
ncbi:hypothetical protein G3M48_007369 [Beauveria asiatica]|uniref:Uncharacterized protein n=1 Tax=Beauveria asiatica TaxID=1069075 RepID=A0AAW0RMT3_9HYPO